jgi:predicted kinase
MHKPLLIIVNGLPASGKSTLAKRLGQDLQLPVFSRDAIYEVLVDELGVDTLSVPPALGSAAFSLFYHVIGAVLASKQSVIIEQYFGRPDMRTAELLDLQRRHDFEPFQILCHADGDVLIERFMVRAASSDRHAGHGGADWLEQNKRLLLSGPLTPLALDGTLVEVDTTEPGRFDYEALVQQLRPALT